MMIMAQAVIIGLKNMSKKRAKKGRREILGEEGREAAHSTQAPVKRIGRVFVLSSRSGALPSQWYPEKKVPPLKRDVEIM